MRDPETQDSSGITLAYALQTHAAPAQVERLVATLIRQDPTCLIHVSHDRKGPPLSLGVTEHPSVHVSLDEGGRGRFCNVARWLAMARWLRDTNPTDYVVTLTGQDYPVRPLRDLHEALEASGDGLMEYFPVFRTGHKWPMREGETRYLYDWKDLRPISRRTKKWLRPLTSVNLVQDRLRVNVAFDALRLGVRRRALIPHDGHVWGGSFFTNLSWRAVLRVLAAADDRDFMDWARSSLLIEEAFFQTILMNSPGFSFTNTSGRFYDFVNGPKGSPAVLGIRDVRRAVSSGAFFARKWDPNGPVAVYDRLDAALAG